MGLVQQSGPSLAESKGGIPFNTSRDLGISPDQPLGQARRVLVEDLSCSLVHDGNDDIVLHDYKTFRNSRCVDSSHHGRKQLTLFQTEPGPKRFIFLKSHA